jgi:hypothetical protein
VAAQRELIVLLAKAQRRKAELRFGFLCDVAAWFEPFFSSKDAVARRQLI